VKLKIWNDSLKQISSITKNEIENFKNREKDYLVSSLIGNAWVLSLKVVCANIGLTFIVDQRNFKARCLQNGEENWTKK